MRAFEFCPANPSHSSIRRHDYQWRQIIFKRSIEERKALDVQHVHFVNEQHLRNSKLVLPISRSRDAHPRNDFGFALFPPFSYFCVNLIAQFGLDLSGVACKQGKEALCSTVDDIDFVE